MKDSEQVLQEGLILGDDRAVDIERQENVSPLDYLSYLVACMSEEGTSDTQLKKGTVYVLTIVDDTSGKFEGPYFKIVKCSANSDALGTYEIDIGYPSENIITDFSVEDNEGFSILYDYQGQLNSANFAQRIDDNGNLVDVYAPVISSGNSHYKTNEADKNLVV